MDEVEEEEDEQAVEEQGQEEAIVDTALTIDVITAVTTEGIRTSIIEMGQTITRMGGDVMETDPRRLWVMRMSLQEEGEEVVL